MKVLFTIEVSPPEFPRVKYFVKAKDPKKNGKPLNDVTEQVARLQIIAVPDDAEGAHWLKRVDAQGAEVWQTRHPSLKETFWHAEWEYEVKEEAWAEG